MSETIKIGSTPEPKKDCHDPKCIITSWLLLKLAHQPRWVQALAVAAVAAVGAFLGHLFSSSSSPSVVNVQVVPPAPVSPVTPDELTVRPVQQAAESSEEVEARNRTELQKRWLARLIRQRVSERLQKDGFAAVGGSSTPLPRDRAESLAKQLDDHVITTSFQEVYGPLPAQGPFMDFIRRVIEWVRTHPEELQRLIEFLLSLLLLIA